VRGSRRYIGFLKTVNPVNCFDEELDSDLRRFNVGGYDCPIFDGLFQYVQMYTGGSVAAAVKLNRADVDIAINWSGGMHHARKAQAAGHCYANDAVLAILELLRCAHDALFCPGRAIPGMILACAGTTRGCFTSTSTTRTAMVSRRHSTARTG
jgi:hypothetical protein